MKKIISGMALATLSLISVNVFAASTTGIITDYHLNSGVFGRGACIQMSPAVPTGGWACLYTNNALYKEINEMLLSAAIARKNISVTWTATDSQGLAIVQIADVY